MDHCKFEDAIHYYEAFLASNLGWIEDNIRACLKLADCYAQLNQKEKMIAATLSTFTYDTPRPEACCILGYYFMEKHKNHEAIYWYKQALQYKNNDLMSFQNTSFSTWLPHLQLCVLYDRFKQFHKAYDHNECARKYKPKDPIILENKEYFDRFLENKGRNAENV